MPQKALCLVPSFSFPFTLMILITTCAKQRKTTARIGIGTPSLLLLTCYFINVFIPFVLAAFFSVLVAVFNHFCEFLFHHQT